MTARKTPGGVWETAKTIIYAVAIALVFRTFFYEPFNIPSGSMKPTLLIGDYLFVSKFSYGYSRHSLPLSLNLFPGRILASEPERGDVIVFKYPRDNKTDYIKRLVGLPGDRVQVKGGVLHLNGAPVQRDRIENFIEMGTYGQSSVPSYVETLPEGVSHRILEVAGDRGPLDDTLEEVVPPGHYFFMGDNRDQSNDSRVADVHFVPRDNLVGRAEFLFFSTDGSAEWWEIWAWPFAIRFDRLFSAIR